MGNTRCNFSRVYIGDKIMPFTMEQRVPSIAENNRNFADKINFDLRVASPAIVKSFDADKQTITAQITIKERVVINGLITVQKIPVLLDVPIFMPRAGGYTITMPVKEDDECLIIFGDTCIDSWYKSGGEENEQNKTRRHNLSDGFALIGVWSQPRVLSDYSEDSIQIRNDDASTMIEIKDDEVTVKATTVNLGDSAGVRKLIDDRLINLFNNHTHTYLPGTGSSTPTGVPATQLTPSTCATENTGAI